MKINIGKNTLGDNDKMSVSLREYDRSTHDLSFAWRSTMGVGTLVPSQNITTIHYLINPNSTLTYLYAFIYKKTQRGETSSR